MNVESVRSPSDRWSNRAMSMGEVPWIFSMRRRGSVSTRVHDHKIEKRNSEAGIVCFGQAMAKPMPVGRIDPVPATSGSRQWNEVSVLLFGESAKMGFDSDKWQLNQYYHQDGTGRKASQFYVRFYITTTHRRKTSAKRATVDRQRYEDRIKILRSLAREDGYDLNPESGKKFWSFIDSIPLIRKGDLVLLENGDLRAVWDDEYGAHIGLQFQGYGEVQYVIFSRRTPSGSKRRKCGAGDFGDVKRQIKSYDLWSLVSD